MGFSGELVEVEVESPVYPLGRLRVELGRISDISIVVGMTLTTLRVAVFMTGLLSLVAAVSSSVVSDAVAEVGRSMVLGLDDGALMIFADKLPLLLDGGKLLCLSV